MHKDSPFVVSLQVGAHVSKFLLSRLSLLFCPGVVTLFLVLPRMVFQITFRALPVIRLGLGLCFVASVIAFDMTLNTNVCFTSSVSPVSLLILIMCFPVGRVCIAFCLEERHIELQSSRYWGQNSYGAVNSNTAAWQQPIGFYCGVCFSLVTDGSNTFLIHCNAQDNTVDTFPVAFLTEFYSTGNLPTINLANVSHCFHFHYRNNVSPPNPRTDPLPCRLIMLLHTSTCRR